MFKWVELTKWNEITKGDMSEITMSGKTSKGGLSSRLLGIQKTAFDNGVCLPKF